VVSLDDLYGSKYITHLKALLGAEYLPLFQTFQGIFIFMTYREQLRSPQWQRMQSEIRMRDDFKCRLCGATDKYLHVHHLYYKPSTNVWDYDKEALVTLCEDCHNTVHSSLPKIISLAIFQIIKDGACVFDIQKYLLEKTNIPQQDKILF